MNKQQGTFGNLGLCLNKNLEKPSIITAADDLAFEQGHRAASHKAHRPTQVARK